MDNNEPLGLLCIFNERRNRGAGFVHKRIRSEQDERFFTEFSLTHLGFMHLVSLPFRKIDFFSKNIKRNASRIVPRITIFFSRVSQTDDYITHILKIKPHNKSERSNLN